METNLAHKADEILAAIKLYQGFILDAMETEVDEDTVLWTNLRGRVLRALGDRGLAYRVRVILGVSAERGRG